MDEIKKAWIKGYHDATNLTQVNPYWTKELYDSYKEGLKAGREDYWKIQRAKNEEVTVAK